MLRKGGLMEKEKIRKQLIGILDKVPVLKEILLSSDPLETKRTKFRYFLSDMLFATFEDDPTIPPLEWILTRSAINVFRNLLATRSERLAGYSILGYINDLLHKEDIRDMEEPSPGFLAEFEHLIKAIIGKTGIYQDKVPAYLKYEGREAAKLRSADLSEMARTAQKFMDHYACGLDSYVIRRRADNRLRIMKYFHATDAEWDEWKWQTNHIIRNADTLKSLVYLTDEDYQSVTLARKNRIPFGITPYYLSLMDNGPDRKYDYAVRAQVIPPMDYVEKMKAHKACSRLSMDFMLEHDTSPIEGITRRYPQIVIIKPILTCPQICVYCQRNWEIEDVYSPKAVLSKELLEKAVQWIRDTPEINEVLITGGDPLLLSDEKIGSLMSELANIPHLERIRIGTRTPVTLPQRITEPLVEGINRFHIPGKREIIIITHFEHPYEITPESVEAVQKFREYGIDVYNQLVYTFFNSRKFEASALRHRLRLSGVTPYYTFNTKGKEETDIYRVPIARLLQEQHEEARLFPGTVRTDEIVFNVPRLGKNYLRASQHHDVISVLPNGRRVYEFHPWEKILSLVDTYVYTDVSIYDYVRRLKDAGEDIADYKSIWYYY